MMPWADFVRIASLEDDTTAANRRRASRASRSIALSPVAPTARLGPPGRLRVSNAVPAVTTAYAGAQVSRSNRVARPWRQVRTSVRSSLGQARPETRSDTRGQGRRHRPLDDRAHPHD